MPSRSWHSLVAREIMQATNTRNPQTGIVQLARALLNEAEIAASPVNLHLLASFQRIHEIGEVDMPHAGRLIPEDAHFRVEVNARHSRGKQRFSIGHEIGHTFIPSYRRQPRIIQDMTTGLFEAGQEEEYLCDTAAAEILLPDQLFRPQAASLGCNLDAVVKLARLFDASREATARRLVEMNMWPCALAVWHVAYKKSESHVSQQLTFVGSDWKPPIQKLRLRYAVASKHFGYYLYPGLSAHDGGSLMQCFTSNVAVCGGEHFLLSRRDVTFQVMAAPRNFTDDNGSHRDVLSLILASRVVPRPQENRPELWANLEDDEASGDL